MVGFLLQVPAPAPVFAPPPRRSDATQGVADQGDNGQSFGDADCWVHSMFLTFDSRLVSGLWRNLTVHMVSSGKREREREREMYAHTHTDIYIYRERERERQLVYILDAYISLPFLIAHWYSQVQRLYGLGREHPFKSVFLLVGH